MKNWASIPDNAHKIMNMFNQRQMHALDWYLEKQESDEILENNLN